MQKFFFRRFTKKVFIYSNIIIALLFLAGSNVKYLDPVKWWFIHLLTLALPYLLLLLILFILFWIFVKPAWSLISLVVILASLHAVQNIIPLNLPSAFELNKTPGHIRVMSWNVELFNILEHKTHPEKKLQMLDLINKYDPDIACLQEVVAGDYKNAINYLPGILDRLHFKDYLYTYQLRNDFDQHHHFGILVLSKYPIVRKQAVVNKPNDYNSSFQFIDVVVRGDTIRVFNVHLQSLKFSEQNLEYIDHGAENAEKNIKESKGVAVKIRKGVVRRSSQARFLKDEMNHSPYPIILCGDFNDVPDSYAYELIGKGLQNAFVKRGAGISRTFNGISPTLRIDNIFVSEKFAVSQFTRIKRNLSDHFPIVADLKISDTLHQ